jgi:hypothetical protein
LENAMNAIGVVVVGCTVVETITTAAATRVAVQ